MGSWFSNLIMIKIYFKCITTQTRVFSLFFKSSFSFQIFFFSANYFNSFVFFLIKVNSFILITEIVLLNFMFVSNVREDSILVVWFPHCPSSRLHRFKLRASFFFFMLLRPRLPFHRPRPLTHLLPLLTRFSCPYSFVFFFFTLICVSLMLSFFLSFFLYVHYFVFLIVFKLCSDDLSFDWTKLPRCPVLPSSGSRCQRSTSICPTTTDVLIIIIFFHSFFFSNLNVLHAVCIRD